MSTFQALLQRWGELARAQPVSCLWGGRGDAPAFHADDSRGRLPRGSPCSHPSAGQVLYPFCTAINSSHGRNRDNSVCFFMEAKCNIVQTKKRAGAEVEGILQTQRPCNSFCTVAYNIDKDKKSGRSSSLLLQRVTH